MRYLKLFEELHIYSDIVVEILPEFRKMLELEGSRSWWTWEWDYDKGIITKKLKGCQEMYLGTLKNKTNTGPEFTQVTLEFVPSNKEIRYNEYNTREVNLRGLVNKDSRFISVLKQDGGGPNYYTKFNNIEVGEVDVSNYFKIKKIED